MAGRGQGSGVDEFLATPAPTPIPASENRLRLRLILHFDFGLATDSHLKLSMPHRQFAFFSLRYHSGGRSSDTAPARGRVNRFFFSQLSPSTSDKVVKRPA